MWLIDVRTYKLHEFLGNSSTFPSYAILSHTWGDGEVSLQDFRDSLSRAKKKTGFQKIKYCCEQTAEDGFRWAWVDTCCINKTSSSELSEAINSMYNWYRNALACYVYLSDVHLPEKFHLAMKRQATPPHWFTRGWTLQELIAPLSVRFYSNDWRFLGTKKETVTGLSNITGIDSKVLLHERSLNQILVAERMYWASSRKTTRDEDQAYCLMGLFDVNMPLLYGEGTKAFDRLQEQILRTTNDDTLFLWQLRNIEREPSWMKYVRSEPEGNCLWQDPGDKSTLNTSRMLASSPSDFDRRAGHYLPQQEEFFCEPQLMPRQLGLRITLHMRKMDLLDTSRFELPPAFKPFLGRVFIAALGCLTQDNEGNHSQVAILLEASTEADSPEKKVLRRMRHLHCFYPLLETRKWKKYTCFVAGDAPNSFGKMNKSFQLGVLADKKRNFPILLGCMGLMSATQVIECRETGQNYRLTFAMDECRPGSAHRRADIQVEALSDKHEGKSGWAPNRSRVHDPDFDNWTLNVREGYGSVLEHELLVDRALELKFVLDCREDTSWRKAIYQLHVRCRMIDNTSL
ncbi:hypothetical protein Daus18300_014362 [Diaporthe australafricana]|uniref:HET domain-containing protein n=1 Tax=Diaporthe australafricana TaxID=127596 RepID=A0ABR3VVJ5_9PEZI